MDWPDPRPAGWFGRAVLTGGRDLLVFHARDKLAATLTRGGFRLMSALADHARGQGWQVEVVPYTPDGQDLATACGGHLHIYMEDRPVYAANALHCVPAYLRGWWYCDEVGSRNNSANRLVDFDPRLVVAEYAKRFHSRVANRFIGANLSKFPQAAGDFCLPPGYLAFFAQDFQAPRFHRHYLTVPQLLQAALAARGDRPLVIKPHPNNSPDERAVLLAHHAPDQGVHVTDASIHAILPGAACVLTVTSAVGFEAFLHRKPVVLAGQTDFGQNAITLTDPARLTEAISTAMARDWPHEKFVTWFLRHRLLEDRPSSLPVLLARLQRKGIGFAKAAGPGFY